MHSLCPMCLSQIINIHPSLILCGFRSSLFGVRMLAWKSRGLSDIPDMISPSASQLPFLWREECACVGIPTSCGQVEGQHCKFPMSYCSSLDFKNRVIYLRTFPTYGRQYTLVLIKSMVFKVTMSTTYWLCIVSYIICVLVFPSSKYYY